MGRIDSKGLWDELGSMETLSPCTYGSSKAINEINNKNKFIQFLIDLNNIFGLVRD